MEVEEEAEGFAASFCSRCESGRNSSSSSDIDHKQSLTRTYLTRHTRTRDSEEKGEQ